MKKILAVVALSIVTLGCEGIFPRPHVDSKYGEFEQQVQAAEARAASLALDTDSLVVNHKKMTEHLKEQGITKYRLSFDSAANRFNLQYTQPQGE